MVGCPSHLHALPLVHLRQLHRPARGRGVSGAARALFGGAGDTGGTPHPVHPFERLPVRHHASPPYRREAELSIIAEGDADDAAAVPVVVHAALFRLRSLALRLRNRARCSVGCGIPCLRLRFTITSLTPSRSAFTRCTV